MAYVESNGRGMVTSVLGHFGPKDRTGHQKDRSAHAIRQPDVGVGMHVHRRHGVIMTFEATMGTGDVTLDADA